MYVMCKKWREKEKIEREKEILVKEEDAVCNGKKRVRESEIKVVEEKIDGRTVKYVGETARSCYERQKEHYNGFNNMYLRSHILKHFLDAHRNISFEELERNIRVRVIGRYRTSFERQIGESIWLNNYLKNGVTVLNSRNEYNRCKIPRLGLELQSYDALEEYKEKQLENQRKQEIHKLREKLRHGKELPKDKRRRLNSVNSVKEEKVMETERESEERITRRENSELVLLEKQKEERLLRNIKKKRLKGTLQLTDKKKIERKAAKQ